jgi:ribonuclease HI
MGNACSQIQTMCFDGSKSQERSGVGCILINPKDKRHFLSCRLEFECTNTTTEYEALVQRLKKSIALNVKELKVFRDPEIIIKQVKFVVHHSPSHSNNYQRKVHRPVDHFEAFNVTMIPRVKNIFVDSLAMVVSWLSPPDDSEPEALPVSGQVLKQHFKKIKKKNLLLSFIFVLYVCFISFVADTPIMVSLDFLSCNFCSLCF